MAPSNSCSSAANAGASRSLRGGTPPSPAPVISGDVDGMQYRDSNSLIIMTTVRKAGPLCKLFLVYLSDAPPGTSHIVGHVARDRLKGPIRNFEKKSVSKLKKYMEPESIAPINKRQAARCFRILSEQAASGQPVEGAVDATGKVTSAVGNLKQEGHTSDANNGSNGATTSKEAAGPDKGTDGAASKESTPIKKSISTKASTTSKVSKANDS